MKLLITGATGYIGQRLVCAAQTSGHQVFIAGRAPGNIFFDLSKPQPVVLPEKFDAVLHLAAITSSSATNPDAEIGAAEQLIDAAVLQNSRFIFVSSQASREDAPTDYGRTKWQIEQRVLAVNGHVVRPGQVYGGFESGLFGVLATAIRKLPAYPAFIPAPSIQPVHVDDLVAALLSCASNGALQSSIFNIGAETPISFTRFLQSISKYWIGRLRVPIPVPVLLIRLVITAVGEKLRTKLGLERLNSLFDLQPMQTQPDLQRLGIKLRSLDSGMHRSGLRRRRDLALEGQALLSYVIGTKAPSELIRKYISCIEQLRNGRAIGLKERYLNIPKLIHLIDLKNINKIDLGQEFIWRLNAAVFISETSIIGAERFLGIGHSSNLLNNGFCIFSAVVQEMLWRIVRLLMMPIIKNPFDVKANSEKQA